MTVNSATISKGMLIVHTPTGRVCTCLKVSHKPRGVVITGIYKERKKSNGIYLIYNESEWSLYEQTDEITGEINNGKTK